MHDREPPREIHQAGPPLPPDHGRAAFDLGLVAALAARMEHMITLTGAGLTAGQRDRLVGEVAALRAQAEALFMQFVTGGVYHTAQEPPHARDARLVPNPLHRGRALPRAVRARWA